MVSPHGISTLPLPEWLEQCEAQRKQNKKIEKLDGGQDTHTIQLDKTFTVCGVGANLYWQNHLVAIKQNQNYSPQHTIKDKITFLYRNILNGFWQNVGIYKQLFDM